MSATTKNRFEFALLSFVLLAIAAWLMIRLSTVRPAILGDEWVYTMSSRHGELWGLSPDPLGNFLFNTVYRSTLLCGPEFYACGKFLNLFFFIGFVVVVYLIARQIMDYRIAAMASTAIALSPISVYVSMYLPESLYFFLLALSTLFIFRAIQTDFRWDWLFSGLFLGLAALTKPHALLTLIAFSIFVLVHRTASDSFRGFSVRVFSAILGFLLGRFLIGFLVAGPKAILILNSYGLSNVVSSGAQSAVSTSGSAQSSLFTAMISLFPNQFTIHSQASIAIVGSSIAILLTNLGFLLAGKREKREAVSSFALLVLIWLGVMIVAIVAFTGWITGSGDDHTTRVLLRYYDFLFPIVFIAALGIATQLSRRSVHPLIRWLPAAVVLFVGTVAFTGSFASLTIQIADAPNLAGLVVDRPVFDLVAILFVLALGLLAFFPRHLNYSLPIFVLLAFVSTGFQAQEQYRNFRGQDSSADVIGKLLYQKYPREVREDILIIATSRFDARVASLWMDTNNELLLVTPGSMVPEQAVEGHPGILIMGDVSTDSSRYESALTGDGYVLRMKDSAN
jgi:phosphoglycerol transferase